MPSFSGPPDSVACWRKRKRDYEDTTSLARPTTFFPVRGDRPKRECGYSMPLSQYPIDDTDLSFRPLFLPRKRQHIQGPYVPVPAQESPYHLSPNVYASPQDPYSPPVSPKTMVPISYTSAPPSVLRPCHVCHRRPATRKVLDAYADCELCGERACFICLRQCDSLACSGSFTKGVLDGDTNPQRKICSRCAVEGITDTGIEIVRCLDCVHGPSTRFSAESMASEWSLDRMNLDGA